MKKLKILLIILFSIFFSNIALADVMVPGQNCHSYDETCYNKCISNNIKKETSFLIENVYANFGSGIDPNFDKKLKCIDKCCIEYFGKEDYNISFLLKRFLLAFIFVFIIIFLYKRRKIIFSYIKNNKGKVLGLIFSFLVIFYSIYNLYSSYLSDIEFYDNRNIELYSYENIFFFSLFLTQLIIIFLLRNNKYFGLSNINNKSIFLYSMLIYFTSILPLIIKNSEMGTCVSFSIILEFILLKLFLNLKYKNIVLIIFLNFIGFLLVFFIFSVYYHFILDY